MKNKWTIYIVLAVVLISGIFIFSNMRKKKQLVESGVVATSKKGNVTEKDVQTYLETLKKSFGQTLVYEDLKTEEKKLIISDIINNRLILEEAKKSKITTSDEFKERLVEVKDNLLKEMYIQDLIAKNIYDGDIKSKYDELSKALEGKKEYRVSHILVEKEEDIKKVVNDLKERKFSDVAKEYSIDSSKDNGGEMVVIEGQTVKEFDDTLKKLPLNRISEPFKTQFGWHVVIKREEKDAVVPEFDKAKDTIKAALTKEFIKNYSTKNVENIDITVLK